MEHKIHILTAFNNYTWNEVKYLYNSLKKLSFQGSINFVLYDQDEKRDEEFLSKGINLIYSKLDNLEVVVKRFYDYSQFCATLPEEDIVFCVDTADLIFQVNPYNFFSNNPELLKKDLFLGSEAILYKDETWGRNNIIACYPLEAESMMTKEIYNAGSFSGKAGVLKTFCQEVYLKALEGKFYNADQAALNILAHHKWFDSCAFLRQASAYAVQCGTVKDPEKVKYYKNFLLEGSPTLQEDLVVYKDVIPMIIHQYNRVPQFNGFLRHKYAFI